MTKKELEVQNVKLEKENAEFKRVLDMICQVSNLPEFDIIALSRIGCISDCVSRGLEINLKSLVYPEKR